MLTITAQFIARAFNCEFRELVPAAIDRALGHARGCLRFVQFEREKPKPLLRVNGGVGGGR
jgi:hypothetical protein